MRGMPTASAAADEAKGGKKRHRRLNLKRKERKEGGKEGEREGRRKGRKERGKGGEREGRREGRKERGKATAAPIGFHGRHSDAARRPFHVADSA